MKSLLLFGLLLLPALGFSQVADSVGVAKEVDSLVQVCRTLTGQGKYDDAMQVIESAKKKAGEVFGLESAVYANCTHNQGRVFYFWRKYDKAEPLYLEAKATREKLLGNEHKDYAQSLLNLALLYQAVEEYEKSESFYLKNIAIRKKVLGDQHKDYATSIGNLAILYWNMGDYDKSEALYLEAKAIQEKVLGTENPDYARTLNNLAVLYVDKGEYEKAEALHLKAIPIREKVLGKEHPDYAASLDNLASLYYRANRDYGKAEPLYVQAKLIREKALGNTDPDYAGSLNNLAGLYKNIGEYDKAEPLYVEAIGIWKAAQGDNHRDYALSLYNLASLYSKMEDHDKAEPLYLEAKAIWKKGLGTGHPHYAVCLSSLASLYEAKGDYAKAEPLHLEATAIYEKVLGNEHPEYAASLHSLALLYRDVGRPNKPELFFIEASSINKHILQKSATYLPSQELEKNITLYQDENDAFTSFNHQTTSGTFRTETYNNALFYKGFGLETAARLEQAVQNAPDSIREIHSRWKGYNRLVAAELSKPVAERKHVVRLDSMSKLLEKTLLRAAPSFAEARRQFEWHELRNALQPGSAAVEFIHYRYSDKKTTDSTMYAALVLRSGDTAPQFIPLFEERELASLLKGASGRAFTRINALYATQPGNAAQKSLYDLIWKPLEKVLNSPSGAGGVGVKTVYCSPSGLLHRLNLGAIPTPSEGGSVGETFADQYQLVLLGSTRQLVVPDKLSRSGSDAQLFGGIRYTTDSTAIAAVNERYDGTRGLESVAVSFRSDSTLRGDSWNYLPETATEVREIQQIFQSKNWSAQLDTGYFATEEAFRNLGIGKPSPRCLHIATHGFFFPDPKSEARGERVRSEMGEPVFRLSEHPMIRSGLILAGAQQAWSSGKPPEGREDGILTAYEISQMNLSNTELVVLSACETGLGEIAGNEGVYGLQRAFKIAGAKYLIMSLWKVSDQSTRELMTDFYQHWLGEGLAIPEAFRKAQGAMKGKYPDAPYHWAGFVLVE